MPDNTRTDQDPIENIEIFSTDDEKIKSIGELLTNDSSRTILQLLFKDEMIWQLPSFSIFPLLVLIASIIAGATALTVVAVRTFKK